MAKASPMARSFNAGEFSELMAGRVDIDKYPASLRKFRNFISAPQGPALARSGTAFVAYQAFQNAPSNLLPFVFSEDQAKVLEIAPDRIRFLDDVEGLQAYPAVAATVNTLGALTSAGLNAEVGDDVKLSGFSYASGLNDRVVRVTAKAGNIYTVEGTGGGQGTGMAARVYHVPHTFSSAFRASLKAVQSVDVVYLLSKEGQPRKLSRYGYFDWRLERLSLTDGPYLPVNSTPTTLTPSGTGNVVPVMTSNSLPAGASASSTDRPLIDGTIADPKPFLGRNLTYRLGNASAWLAFNESDNTYWAANTEQRGWISYAPATPFVLDGYTIYVATDNQDTSYTSTDYAPTTWVLEGRNGATWTTLDQQENYVLYENNKSVFFNVENNVAYEEYRLRIVKLKRNGQIEPRIGRLVMRSKTRGPTSLTASSVEGINRGLGFVAGDVGRLVRLKGRDGAWRQMTITSVISPTQVLATIDGEPFYDLKPISEWRLGHWSAGTGWPNAGAFFEDRLWLAGSRETPDIVTGSVIGDYENFAPTDTFGEVLDDSAVAFRATSRKLSRVMWVEADSRGLLLGTGSEEFTVASPNNEAITARNIKARPATKRGSADVNTVSVDNQVLYVQRGGRTLREFAYVYESDGYRSPSMSQLASHIGAVPFAELAYAAEPHSLVWARRQDGTMACLTYNREENVVGWHQHDFSGVVESMTVIPQRDQLQDALWLSVRRVVNGQVVRTIERLMPFWDFNSTIATAHFLDAAVRHSFEAPRQLIKGLGHLEGKEVYGLADGLPVGPFTVADGAITLEFAASNVLVGLGYESEGVVPRLENGAKDGTAQGKEKRINNISVMMWASYGGEIGVWNSERGAFVYEPIDYPEPYDVIQEVKPYTGVFGPFTVSPGYDKDGIMAFRKPKESPLPFNVVAFMPQLNTQDR